MKITELKNLVASEVDAQRRSLTKLSLKLHANPELGFQETKAAGWLTKYLAQNGFTVESGICGLATAFRGFYGDGKPVVAILAEYDALPDLGHACGHNLIAASAIGAAIVCKLVIDQLGGSVLVIGTPAEEIYGGKVIMAERGAFSDVDVAMMMHPGTRDTATIQTLACQTLEVEFLGKAAHAAAHPEEGVNALEAMIQSFNAVNSLRQHMESKARIHGIITDGGEAANIVPAHSASTFIVRAEDEDYLNKLKERVLSCFVGAATATGARLKYRWNKVLYATMRNNLTLARFFKQNMESLGRRIKLTDPDCSLGSTDMGNVSQLVPSIHPEVAVAPRGVSVHSSEFALAAISEAGNRGLLDAAKALAMTVVDLFSSPVVITKVKEEFELGKRG